MSNFTVTQRETTVQIFDTEAETWEEAREKFFFESNMLQITDIMEIKEFDDEGFLINHITLVGRQIYE